MNDIKKILGIILILFSFILLYNPFMIAFANITTIFRKDNSIELKDTVYQQKINNLEETIAEYERALESLKIYDNSTFVLSKVGIRNIYDFYDFLIISTDTKVNNGAAVVNENGLIGLIKESNKNTAKVELITGDISLSVQINGSYGILNGYDKDTGLFLVHNINNYKDVNVGDEVLTSGFQKIDKNILVGYVSKVENDGIENLLYIKPSVDFNNINYLMVINK